MRELFERFGYRFQLWQKERSDEPAAGGNPLRIFAVVAVVSLVADAYYIIRQHRIDAMMILGMISAAAFLFFYIRLSMWAWYLVVIEGPVFLLLYWLLLAFGGLSRARRPAPLGFHIGVLCFRLRYSGASCCRHAKTSNQAIQLTADRSDASRTMTSTLPLQFKLALASGS